MDLDRLGCDFEKEGIHTVGQNLQGDQVERPRSHVVEEGGDLRLSIEETIVFSDEDIDDHDGGEVADTPKDRPSESTFLWSEAQTPDDKDSGQGSASVLQKEDIEFDLMVIKPEGWHEQSLDGSGEPPKIANLGQSLVSGE